MTLIPYDIPALGLKSWPGHSEKRTRLSTSVTGSLLWADWIGAGVNSPHWGVPGNGLVELCDIHAAVLTSAMTLEDKARDYVDDGSDLKYFPAGIIYSAFSARHLEGPIKKFSRIAEHDSGDVSLLYDIRIYNATVADKRRKRALAGTLSFEVLRRRTSRSGLKYIAVPFREPVAYAWKVAAAVSDVAARYESSGAVPEHVHVAPATDLEGDAPWFFDGPRSPRYAWVGARD